AERRAGKGIEPAKGTGNLERRQLLPAQGFELGRVQRRVGDDVRDRNFAADFVRCAHHGGFAHPGILEQKLLDLSWIDVESAGDDQIAAASAKGVVAIRRANAEISGTKPALVKGRGCRIRTAPVFREEME